MYLRYCLCVGERDTVALFKPIYQVVSEVKTGGIFLVEGWTSTVKSLMTTMMEKNNVSEREQEEALKLWMQAGYS